MSFDMRVAAKEIAVMFAWALIWAVTELRKAILAFKPVTNVTIRNLPTVNIDLSRDGEGTVQTTEYVETTNAITRLPSIAPERDPRKDN